MDNRMLANSAPTYCIGEVIYGRRVPQSTGINKGSMIRLVHCTTKEVRILERTACLPDVLSIMQAISLCRPSLRRTHTTPSTALTHIRSDDRRHFHNTECWGFAGVHRRGRSIIRKFSNLISALIRSLLQGHLFFILLARVCARLNFLLYSPLLDGDKC